jgi:hypothetical protein
MRTAGGGYAVLVVVLRCSNAYLEGKGMIPC